MEMSPQINELAAALAKAQAQMKPAIKDSLNPHFRSKYAGLASVWDACRDALTTNGLSIVQPISTNAGIVTVHTILLHTSGQFIKTELGLPLKDVTAQAIGSAVSYGRRYGLAAMVGVAPDDDDDGNEASLVNTQTGEITQPRPRPPLSPPEKKAIESGNGDILKISDAQRKRLWAIAKGKGWADDAIKDFIETEFGYTSTKDILRSQYDEIVKTIEVAP